MIKQNAIVRWVLAFLCTAAGCTWSRFDDITDNPPVERLEAPNGTVSLGMSMATFPTASGTTLAVSSSNKLVTFDLGAGSNPSLTATTAQSCAGDSSCFLTQHLAGLRAQPMTENQGCVAYGLGIAQNSANQSLGELWLYCEDATRHSLPIPDTAKDWLLARVNNAQLVVDVATTRRGAIQPLVASLPDANIIWFYDGTSLLPTAMPSLQSSQSAGQTLAVLVSNSGYIVAAGSSVPPDTVWFFQTATDGSAVLTSCVTGHAGFGRLLTTGKFDADDLDDLVVADATSIYVVAGSSLIALQANGTSTCTTIDSVQLIAKAQCSTWTNLNGCVGQTFATAVMTANLDGTGTDELVVGVPDTTVRGETAAGAVFIYGTNSGGMNVEDGLYVSSASAGDRLGSSLAAVPLSGVEGVLAGAPGDNSVMAFYCDSLMPAASKSARCP